MLPILHRKKEDVDYMLFTYVTLHNMLHAFDHMDVMKADVEWGGRMASTICGTPTP